MNLTQQLEELAQSKLVFLDSETCGLAGVAVLLQWAADDGEIHLWDVFQKTFDENLQLLTKLADTNIVGFNLTFDCFHLVKLFSLVETVLKNRPDLADAKLIHHIDLLEKYEEEAIFASCWKAKGLCDLMLVSRKGKYQTLMNRSDVRIRRVPNALAMPMALELERRVEIPEIYFARYAKKDQHWAVYPSEIDGMTDPDFSDVVLKFAPSGSLKALAEHALDREPPAKFQDIELDKSHRPKEVQYCPTARAAREKHGPEALCWPDVVKLHIAHWITSEPAREYAEMDIVYTRDLYYHLDSPELDDDDSVLAGMVATVRWRGFAVDLGQTEKLRDAAQKIVDSSKINTNSAAEVRAYLFEVMSPIERIVLAESTKKEILKSIANSGGEMKNPEAAERAQHILDVKDAMKEVELYDKLLLAHRFHASFKVIGTKSSRMSGTDGLNAQAIKSTHEVRSLFTMTDEGELLLGGDFSSFELSLADAIYDDPELKAILAGDQKLHALFAMFMFPGHTYEEIVASAQSKNDMYSKGKSGVFALLYGGNAFTLHTNQGIPIETADDAVEQWLEMLPGLAEKTKEIEDAFKPVYQDERGAIKWADPADYVETLDGFRRYFTLENLVAKALYDLANDLPKAWRGFKGKVARRDRLQTASGAACSALYGAMFGILSANVRAAVNHKLQSLGATICKRAQRKVWDVQPHGVQPKMLVRPMQVHDEIMSATVPEAAEQATKAVTDAVDATRPMVPMVGLDWEANLDSWAGTH